MAKRIIKLTETELNRIIKKVISEQQAKANPISNPKPKAVGLTPITDVKKKKGIALTPIADPKKKKGIGLTPKQNNEQTLRSGNLQAPEDMDPNPMQKPKSDFGLKNPGAPKFMTDISPEKNTSAGMTPPVAKTPSKTVGVLSPDLYKGSRGQEVKQYQAALQTLKYGTKPDGIFGPITQTAVMNFQQSNGLKPTGRIDKATGDLILQKAATVNKVNKLGDPVGNVKNTPPPLLARPKTSVSTKSTTPPPTGAYKAGTAGMY